MLNTDTIQITPELLALLSEIDEFKGARCQPKHGQGDVLQLGGEGDCWFGMVQAVRYGIEMTRLLELRGKR